MLFDLCLALPLQCQHLHNIGHRQVSSAWPIKAHWQEDKSITHVQGAGKIMEHRGRVACQAKVIHLNPSTKKPFHFWGPIQVITGEPCSKCIKTTDCARPQQQWIAILHHSEVRLMKSQQTWGARGIFSPKEVRHGSSVRVSKFKE